MHLSSFSSTKIAWNKSLEHLRESRGLRIVLKHMYEYTDTFILLVWSP